MIESHKLVWTKITKQSLEVIVSCSNEMFDQRAMSPTTSQSHNLTTSQPYIISLTSIVKTSAKSLYMLMLDAPWEEAL